MSKAFTVVQRALEELGRRGVRDAQARIAGRFLPAGKPGAEERAVELALEGIGELHARGLEALAAELAAELGVDAPPSARLAGSTPVLADEVPILSGPGSAGGPGSGEPIIDPPPHPDGSPRGVISDERAAGMLAEPASPPVSGPVIDEPHREGDGAALGALLTEQGAAAAPVVLGVDLADGPDATVVALAADPVGGLESPTDLEPLEDPAAAGQGELEIAGQDAARAREAEAQAAQDELPSGSALPEDLPPAAPPADGATEPSPS